MSKTNYALIRAPGSADGDFAKRTAARLEQIQSQLKTRPRGGKLKGKVCIVTGVGSLAGIGCVCMLASLLASRNYGSQAGYFTAVRPRRYTSRSTRR